MTIRVQRGVVMSVQEDRQGGQELWVDVDGELERAYQEPACGVRAEAGDIVLLNTTAVRLGLGTGGTHFVLAVEKRSAPDETFSPGHIMKLRYTPLQRAVHAVEEESHPAHGIMRDAKSLDGTPVVICELHSMLPAVAMTLGRDHPCKVAYVMTDGAALPISFSKTASRLKELGLLHGTVTVGHAYGGDLEAVNLYSGLLAARHVLQADCIVVAMGPGIVGTGTTYGHTGLEVGQAINAVHTLEGDAIAVPRLSFADRRARHYGISHHTLTALGQVALAPATVPLPDLPDEQASYVWSQITAHDLHRKHRLVGLQGRALLDAVQAYPVPLRTMGRTLEEDLSFFLTAGAAGEWAARVLQNGKNPPPRYWGRVSPALTDKNC